MLFIFFLCETKGEATNRFGFKIFLQQPFKSAKYYCPRVYKENKQIQVQYLLYSLFLFPIESIDISTPPKKTDKNIIVDQ